MSFNYTFSVTLGKFHDAFQGTVNDLNILCTRSVNQHQENINVAPYVLYRSHEIENTLQTYKQMKDLLGVGRIKLR
jgi:hypothetical protein